MKPTSRAFALFASVVIPTQLGCGGLREVNGDAIDGFDAAVDGSIADAAPMVGPIAIKVYKQSIVGRRRRQHSGGGCS
jgi:hypothetical protein